MDEVHARASGRNSIYPFTSFNTAESELDLRDPAARTLVSFFKSQGLAVLKQEDRLEQWYDDWIVYQREHGLYAAKLLPLRYSNTGTGFDLLHYSRFLERLAFWSPAHGYSLHVTFLGFFSILMGTNEDLKREAAATIQAGNLLAFGVSEKNHGSDLFANEFTIRDTGAGGLVASGSKYYIGNSDVASIISVLGRKAVTKKTQDRISREPFLFFALRPGQAPGFRSLGKIRTLGVRAANVGAFEVQEHALNPADIIAEGRNAWDAIFGTVTLGKFFLGFGSIGICEHALEEAATHLKTRILYGKSSILMPHIRSNMEQAYVRLTAMKLYAYRALDYVHSSSAADRRYLLYCAVQKAKVSTEGVKVMALLQECIGARGFESDTYFEMALRDVQLIPSLEGSMHINLGLAADFIPGYFKHTDSAVNEPPSLICAEVPSRENVYLSEARTGSNHSIGFRPFEDAYRPLQELPNVASFEHQVESFQKVMQHDKARNAASADLQVRMAIGQCFATVAFGQLVAENAKRVELPGEMISAIFSMLVGDLSELAIRLAALPQFDDAARDRILRMVIVPKTNASDWEFVRQQCGFS